MKSKSSFFSANESFENFLSDTLVRGFNSHDWINEELEALNLNPALSLFNLTEKQRKCFYRVYESMVEKLSKNIMIASGENLYKPVDIYYHKRFGWILANNSNPNITNEIKIFLGKTSILGGVKIVMGKRTYISGHSLIKGEGDLVVGSFCSLAEGLKIFTYSDAHPMNHAAMVNLKGNQRIVEDGFSMSIEYQELDNLKSDVNIGNDVWIGRNVRIKNGVNIGDGCIIGEDSLVRKDCEPYGVYAGYPAKLIRYRFNEEIIGQLSKIKWWNWPMKKFMKNKLFFSTNLDQYQNSIRDLIV